MFVNAMPRVRVYGSSGGGGGTPGAWQQYSEQITGTEINVPGATLPASEAEIEVYVEGIRYVVGEGKDVEVTGVSTLTFSWPLESQLVLVRWFQN